MNISKINVKGEVYNVTDADAQSKITSLLSTTYTKTEVNTALAAKVDVEEGKGLSSNDYTTAEKTKLGGIEEGANNYVHPTTSGNKHVPAGGANGLILVYSAEGTATWSDSSTKLDAQFELLNQAWTELQQEQARLSSLIEALNNNIDLYSYGVEWDITVSSPVLTRIGNPLLHKSLPIQSAYKGCVANQGVINYYLYPENWAFKEDGVTPSVLDGTDGTVRVHTPKFYGKSGSDGNKRWVRTSIVKIDDTWVEIPALLIDAYKCTVDTTDSAHPKAVSVVNTSAAFRGGSNGSGYDLYLETDPCRTQLGKPRTAVSRSWMRERAINAGSELLCYEYYKWIFYWNYVIEYANFNAQAPYNAELTSDGYRLGGLGNGISNMSNWEFFNGYYPVTPCGHGNDIGNFTGVKPLTIQEFTYTRASRQVSSWNANSNVCTSKNGDKNSKVVTEVKAVNNYAFLYNHNEVFSEVTYNVTGLTDGLKVIFKERGSGKDYAASTVVAEATADGDIVVNWSERGTGNDRYIGFAIAQTNCNIMIYNVKSTTISLTHPLQTLQMARWRGFDNPWGDIWGNLDGIIIERTAANSPSNVYTTSDPALFGDSQEAKAKMNLVGVEIAADGWIKTFDLGETGEIIPSAVDASSTTYKCDYHWCNPSRTDLRTLLVGASAYYGGRCGPGAFSSYYGVGSSHANVGFLTVNRLTQ